MVKISQTSMTTVDSPNNRHFGARPTVRYSGGVLYCCVTTFHVLCFKSLANKSYKSCVNMPQGYESTYNLRQRTRRHTFTRLNVGVARQDSIALNCCACAQIDGGGSWVWLGLAPRAQSVMYLMGIWPGHEGSSAIW